MDEIQNYLSPKSLDEALEAMSQGGCTVLAGGTDLMVQAEAGRLSFAPTLLNINRVLFLFLLCQK